MNCIVCGGEMGPPVRANVPYQSLPGVTLCGVEVRECAECGEQETAIPRIDELDMLLARLVAKRPSRLTGPEVRFLRKVMGWSGRAFAKLIGVAPETVSRWENGHEPIGSMADRLLRVLVTQKIEPITDYGAFEAWLDRLGESSTVDEESQVSVRRNPHGEWTAEGECAA